MNKKITLVLLISIIFISFVIAEQSSSSINWLSKRYGDATYGQLDNNNEWTGNNTFTGVTFNVTVNQTTYVVETFNVTGGMNVGENLTVTDGTYNVIISGTTIYSDTAYAPLLQLGLNSLATGSYSVAIGLDAEADSTSGVAIGSGAHSVGVEGMAIGALTYAGLRAFAGGYWVSASGDSSVALGDLSSASGDYSVAIGNQARAIGDFSSAMGSGSIAFGDYSVSIGKFTNASGYGAYAFGDNVTVHGTNSYGFGVDGVSTGNSMFTLHNLSLNVDGSVDIIGNFTVNNSVLFVNRDTSNVGIGTATPTAKLEVNGTTNQEQLIVRGISGQSDDLMQFRKSDETIYSRFDNVGRLGLGHTNPKAALDIIGGSNNQLRLSTSQADSTNKFAYINMMHYDTSEQDFLFFFGSSISTDNKVWFGGGSTSANAATSISFFTAPNNTMLKGIERMTIDGTGNIGIGTAVPTTTLDVNGTVTISGVNSDLYVTDNVYVTGSIAARMNNPYYPLEVNGTARFEVDTGYSIYQQKSHSDTGWHGNSQAMTRSRGTRANPTTIQNGDLIGWFDYWTYNGTHNSRSADWKVAVDGIKQADGIFGGRFDFQTAGEDADNSNEARLTIRNSGLIGFSQTIPEKLLHLGGSTNNVNGSIRFESSDGDNVDLIVTTDDSLYVEGGDFGIGIEPDVALHIKGSVYIDELGSTDRVFNLYDDGDDGIFEVLANNVNTVRLHGNGASYINGGYLSIGGDSTGRNSPVSRLHVQDLSDGDKVLIHTYDSTVGGYTGLLMKVSGNGDDSYQKGGILFERTGSGATGSLHLVVDTATDTGNAGLSDAKLTIEADGTVGIADLAGSYSNGEAYVCVNDDGTIFAKDSACS